MGIDAEMLIRNVPESVVTDEWLTELSWNLCNSIGARHFFVKDGLREPEYTERETAWHQAFASHALYDKWQKADGEHRSTLHAQILADVGPCPEQRRLAIDRTLTRYREDGDGPPGSEYRQDGDSIFAKPGECLLELSIFGRYYGEDYERGDILTYCAMAEWLELHIPGCEVWYGGDSSGVCAEPFTVARRQQLRNHLYSASGRDYFNYRGMQDSTFLPKACSLCPGGVYRGSQSMWGCGGTAGGFHCRGCGKSVETRDSGKTWTEKKDD